MSDLWPGMSQAEWEYVRRYVDDLQMRLGLPHWTIDLQRMPVEDDLWGKFSAVDGRDYGKLFLCEDWAHRSAKQKRETLVHELLHAALNELRVCTRGALEKVIAPGWFGPVETVLNEIEERTIERMTVGLAPQMPRYVFKVSEKRRHRRAVKRKAK